MREAVIVSTARTGLAKSMRGGFNMTHGAAMGGMNTSNITEETLMQIKPALWMPMIETAEIVAERYGVSRERQDRYALESQRRTATA
jgi:acetyl-CoA C-acetyltransferase